MRFSTTTPQHLQYLQHLQHLQYLHLLVLMLTSSRHACSSPTRPMRSLENTSPLCMLSRGPETTAYQRRQLAYPLLTLLFLLLQVRQLLGQRHGRREAHQSWALGHCRSRGLRQTTSALLPADRRVPDMFLHRQPPPRLTTSRQRYDLFDAWSMQRGKQLVK